MISDYLDQYTYQYLMSLALQQIPDTVDKREGSIIYDALAPACYLLAESYMQLKQVVDNTFLTTANGEYLDLRAVEQGLTRYAATYAVRKGTFTNTSGTAATVPIGSRFSTVDGENSVNFYVDSVFVDGNGNVVAGAYNLICEESGTAGNNYTGYILPITNINNLGSAQLTTIITPARDAETDDELRQRYLDHVNEKAFGGNVAEYDQLLKAISGIGDAQIYPVWNGGGTVKCSIVDASYQPVSNEFILAVQNQVDPTPQGTGLGLAPIGHTVTIVTPTATTINISATVSVDNQHTLAQLTSSITSAISDYLSQLQKAWGIPNSLNQYSLSVYISRVTAAILSVSGVTNVTNTTINGSSSDLVLTETGTTQQLPTLGTVTLNEP